MTEAPRTRPSLSIQAAGATDVGRQRTHDEDAVLVRPDLRLYVVADGAGGHNAGNVASALALTTVAQHFEATERAYREQPDVDRFGIPTGARRLAVAVRKANREIIEISRASKKYGGMGSTIVAAAAAARAPALHVAHVGDSRCYRLRDGRLERLTHDHSILHDVIELTPEMPDEAIAKLPRKVVTRALGMEENVRVTVRSFEVAPDDVYLLCSDGLTGELSDEQIRRVLLLPEEPSILVARLIALANEAGGSDNIAAVVLRCAIGEAPLSVLPEPPAPSEAPPEPPPPRPPAVSAPEILVLGIETEADLDDTARIRVVPSESVSSGLIDALDSLVLAHRPKAPRAPCAACGEVLGPDVLYCTRCGAARSDAG
jgi:protein phosphatase